MKSKKKHEKYLTSKVVEQIQFAIDEAGGNEVFFVGYIEDDLKVHLVDIVARGHEGAVPAILSKAQDADVVIHNHPSGHLAPSQADMDIAAKLDSFSVAFYIVNNVVDDIYVVIEPFAKTDLQPLDIDLLKRLIKPGGPISKLLRGYENRVQQLDMIEGVATAFNRDKLALIEAGTGTGKTIAYLLPAIFWSLQNKERVVISTNTINLQEQLIKKDIPFLKKVLDQDFKAVLVKGRSNYICLRKVDDVSNEFDLLADEDEKEELNNLLEWAKHSSDGSKSDLSYIPSFNTWERIAAESDTCTRSKCKHFRECFVNKARRSATRANILVTNHHLLFADLSIKHQLGSMLDVGVLPPYQRIIFDEAHNIENVATEYFGQRVTRFGIIRILGRVHRQRKGILKGLAHTVRKKIEIKRNKISKNLYEKIIQDVTQTIVPQVVTLIETTDRLMDSLYELVKSEDSKSIEIKLRLTPANQRRIFENTLLTNEFLEYINLCTSFASKLLRLCDRLQNVEDYLSEDWSSIIIEIKAQADRIALIANALEDIITGTDEENVRWLQVRKSNRGGHIVRFAQSPLDIGDIMTRAVYDLFGSVIMTSATLTIDQKFDFIENRLGLTNVQSERIRTLSLPPPFDYESQVLLGIITDIVEPNHNNFSKILEELVYKTLCITKGRAFVLFTSYGLLNIIFNKLSKSLEIHNIQPLKQGMTNRHELLHRFTSQKNSALFATDSFWEGVDVVGEALELVIITKLPFKVPKEPIIEARYEAIRKAGGNAFMEYAVPMAVIKFRQGFGRLVRSKSDKGVVAIFDSRIVRKAYGKTFLRSLPVCNTVVGTQKDYFSQLSQFFNSSNFS